MATSVGDGGVNCTAALIVQLSDPEREHSPGRRMFSIAIVVIGCVVGPLMTIAFAWAKHSLKYERLRPRRTLLVASTAISLMFLALTGPGKSAIGPDNWPCALRSFLIVLVVPLLASTFVLRILTFYLSSVLAQNLVRDQRERAAALTAQEDDSATVVTAVTTSHQRSTRRVRTVLSKLAVATNMLFVGRDRSNRRHFDDAASRQRALAALRLVTGPTGTFMLSTIMLIPFVIIAFIVVLSDPVYLAGCSGCALSRIETYNIVFEAVFFLILGLLLSIRTRHLPDPWMIRSETMLCFYGGVVVLVGYCLVTWAPTPPEETWDHQFIVVFGLIAIVAVQSVYQIWMAHRDESGQSRRTKRKSRIGKVADRGGAANSTSNNLTTDVSVAVSSSQEGGKSLKLGDVLADPVLEHLFERHLQNEFGVESLLFLRDVRAWRTSYHTLTSSSRLARAKKLYLIYIDPEAAHAPINVPWDIIGTLREKIVSSRQDIPREVFDQALTEIEDLLSVGALSRFAASEAFAAARGGSMGDNF